MKCAGRSRHTSAPMLGTLALLAVLAITLYAAPGALDPSFGNSGKLTTNFSAVNDSGDYAAAAVGVLGWVVAAGGSNGAGSFDFALARYGLNGALDPTFGTGGKVTTDFNGLSDDRAFSAALESSGKTVLAGVSNSSFALARYLWNGSLDAAFGTGGKVTTSFPSIALAQAVAVQSDGKIVAAGLAGPDFALARYNSDGSLDANFGAGGTVITDVGTEFESAQIHAIAIQADGKIVVAGNYGAAVSENNYSVDYAVARYNTDGTLDGTFATGGIFTLDVSGTMEADGADAVTVLSTGKILVGGFSKGPSNNIELALLRLTASGALDASFGANGQVITGFGAGTFAGIRSLAVQTNGKVIAGGFVDADVTGTDFLVARYHSNGALDASFGIGGMATTNLATNALLGRPTNDEVAGLVIQPTGKIVAIGSSDNDFALARYGR